MDAQVINKICKQYLNAIKRRDQILSQYGGSFDNLKERYLEYRKVFHDKNKYNHCMLSGCKNDPVFPTHLTEYNHYHTRVTCKKHTHDE